MQCPNGYATAVTAYFLKTFISPFISLGNFYIVVRWLVKMHLKTSLNNYCLYLEI